MDGMQYPTGADRSLERELEDMKTSIDMAHQSNRVTQEQVSSCIYDLKLAVDRINALETDMKCLKTYARELEDYCISLDTTIRNHHVLITGVTEYADETVNLVAFRILQACFPEIDVTDIDYCYRIGFNPINNPVGRKKNRPILVKLMREDHRRIIFQNKNALKETEEYGNVYINDDLPQVVNDRRADIRSVYVNAVNKGQNASMAGSKITVNNVTYRHDELDKLPAGLTLGDSKLVQIKGGLAFASHHAYLSNLYHCNFQINGQNFDSVERAYQYSRAMHLKAPEVAKKVLAAKNSRECKKQSKFLESKPEWDLAKRGIMKMIVQEKFSQNSDIKEKLISTGSINLVEGTFDFFWGAGALLGSKTLKEGKWTGRNEMGLILSEVREDLKRTESWKAFSQGNAASQRISHNTYAEAASQNSQSNPPTQSRYANSQGISFVPPENAVQVQAALNDYNLRRNKNANRRAGQGKKSRNNQGVNQQAHGQSKWGGPQPRTVTNIPGNNSIAGSANAAQSGGTAYMGPHSGQYSQASGTRLPSFPNTQVPPPGMNPPPIHPYQYLANFFQGFMGQSMPMTMPPLPQQQSASYTYDPNATPVISTSNPGHNAQVSQNQSQVSNTAPTTPGKKTDPKRMNLTGTSTYGVANEHVSSLSSTSGIRDGTHVHATTMETQPTGDEVLLSPSKTRLIEEIDADNLTICIGSQKM